MGQPFVAVRERFEPSPAFPPAWFPKGSEYRRIAGCRNQLNICALAHYFQNSYSLPFIFLDHLCASAPEIMFRVPEDYIQGINRACLSAYSHDTHLLAYAFMSNHFHIVAETANPDVYMGSIRNGYTKWFNNKYGRQGPLGYLSFHSVELTTADHILDGITYVLRNGVHHNIAHYPSGYPYSSAKYYFMKDLGFQFKYSPVHTWKEQRKHLPWNTNCLPGLPWIRVDC